MQSLDDIEQLSSNNNDMNIDPFSPVKHQPENEFKTPKKLNGDNNNFLSDSQFMDVDADDYNTLLNNFDDNQEELKKFTSIFSNETDFQAFLDVLEKKETDTAAKKSPKFYELARNSLYLQFDPIVQKLSSTLSPDKIKRMSLIRDKQDQIKNFLHEIEELKEEAENNTSSDNIVASSSSSSTNKNDDTKELVAPIVQKKPVTPKTLSSTTGPPPVVAPQPSSLKTPTEEALAFIEKAKIQIKKQNSLSENCVDGSTASSVSPSTTTTQSPSQQAKQQERQQRNDKIQNLLSELSLLDEENEENNHETANEATPAVPVTIATTNAVNITTTTVNQTTTEFDNNENDKSQHQQTNINNQTVESDNSAQLIDLDKYRIDFTTHDNDDDDDDILNFNPTKPTRISNASDNNNTPVTSNKPAVSAGSKSNKPKSISNDVEKVIDYSPASATNGDGSHDNDYIEQINILKENERHHLETIRFLQDENSKFKTIAIEFERIFQNLLKDKEESETKLKQEILEITKERDHLQEDVIGVEKAFDDLHRRFEKLKTKVEEFKKNEEQLQKSNELFKQQIEKEKQKYATLKKHAEEKLELANNEIDKLRKSSAAELQTLKAELRRSEIKISSLELSVQQKDQENTQLTNLLEELLSKVKPN